MAITTQHLVHYLALLLLLGWFLTQAYMCFFEIKAFGDELHLNYSKFHAWSEPTLRRKAWVKLPSSDFIGNWKHKIGMVLGYLQVVSVGGLLLGISQFAYVLAAVHTVMSVLFDNPVLTQTQSAFEGKLRAAVFDVIILGVLIMAAGSRVGQKEILE